MKKLLSLLGAIGLVATSSATVVACGPDNTSDNNDTPVTPDDNQGQLANIDYTTTLSVADLTAKVKEANEIAEDADGIVTEITFYAAGTEVSLDKDNNVVGGDVVDSAFASNATYVYAVKTSTTTGEGDAVKTEVKLISGEIKVNPPVINLAVTELSLTWDESGKLGTSGDITFADDEANSGTLTATADKENLVSITKVGDPNRFTVVSQGIGDVVITISSDLDGVTPVTVSVTITATNPQV